MSKEGIEKFAYDKTQISDVANLEIVNEVNGVIKEKYDVGGTAGCYIACAGACIVTFGAATAVMVVTMDMS